MNRMSNLAEIWELSLVCLSLCKRRQKAYFNLKQNNFILPLIPPEVEINLFYSISKLQRVRMAQIEKKKQKKNT